ncbi:MAG: hypothetical protein JW969_06785 [Spirochaetales bacterium]|nr:hypothetical protein [Spirochaetales bacterium]
MFEPVFGLNPVSFIIIKGFSPVLLCVAVLNMVQRKFLPNWEPKRLATLYMTFILAGLICYSLFLVRFRLSDWLHAISITFIIFLVIIKRKYIFPFAFRCEKCGSRLSPKTIIFVDGNQCRECADKEDAKSA